MNLIIILSIIALSSGAQLNRAYLPPAHAHTSGGEHLLETPIVVADEAVVHNSNAEVASVHDQHQPTEYIHIGNQGIQNVAHHAIQEHPERYHVHQIPERSQAALERHAAVLRQEFENNVESYAYVYETENGIYGEESGVATDGVKAHGAYSYTGDDGKQYSITYTADENGFRPQGDHLPTPHPIPAEILKSLEDNARDEAAGVFDDGSYHEEHYGSNEHAHAVIVNQHEHQIQDTNAIVTDAAVLPAPVLPAPVVPAVGVVEHDLNTVAIPAQVAPAHVNNVYLPPTNYQFVRDKTHNSIAGGLIASNGVKKTYLPPVHHQVIPGNAQSGVYGHVIATNGVRKTYLPPVHQIVQDSAQSGISGQVIVNDVGKTYLPPVHHQVIEDRASHNHVTEQTVTNARKTYLPPVHHTSNVGIQSSLLKPVIVKKTYLPPLKKATTSGVRTYLPPKQIIEDRSSQSGQVFGSRSHKPSFDTKTGYQY